MCGFYKKNYRKNNHVKIVSLFSSHYLREFFAFKTCYTLTNNRIFAARYKVQVQESIPIAIRKVQF